MRLQVLSENLQRVNSISWVSGKKKVQNGLLHAAVNGGCLVFLLMTHVMRVGMHKTSTSEGLQALKDRSRIHNDLKSAKCSQISGGIQKGRVQKAWCFGKSVSCAKTGWGAARDRWSESRHQPAVPNPCGGGKQSCGDVLGGVQAGRRVEGSSCLARCWWLLCLVLGTTLQGRCGPVKESSEESVKNKECRKSDLHRKTEQTSILERGRLINATDLTISPSALTMDTMPTTCTSAGSQKASRFFHWPTTCSVLQHSCKLKAALRGDASVDTECTLLRPQG